LPESVSLQQNFTSCIALHCTFVSWNIAKKTQLECSHNGIKLKQNSFKTVMKLFQFHFVVLTARAVCFSQNKTLRSWNILAVLANHSRQPPAGRGMITIIAVEGMMCNVCNVIAVFMFDLAK